MTDDGFASFFSHPLGVALISAVVAAITASFTSSRIVSISPGHEAQRNAIIATIAAAIVASFGKSWIIHVGIVPSGPARETQFPASSGRSLL